MTTTTTMTAQIDRTKVDLTIPGQDQQKQKDLKEQSPVDVEARTESEKTASDRDYLEQIMGCGDVRRKIMRLESSGSTESLESMGKSSTVTPKYIGDNVPVVREVVQSMEDKICSTVVSAIPFTVQKRKPHDDEKEPNVAELEKQILTPADLALEKLFKCEPPSEVLKISPIEAMALDLKAIDEEVCEKVCEKRKSFVVAEDLCETEKTLTEQVIDLNRQVDQVPARIFTETIEKHLDLEDRDVIEASPKVREVVQDIERKYPVASLEAKPFSPRKRGTPDRKVDVSSIEQQILSDADLILDGLGSKCIPEQKVQSPVSSMNKASSRKPKSPEKKDEKVLAKPDDSFKSVIETVKPSPKEYSDDDSDDEIDIPKPQDKPISHPTSLVTAVTGSGDKSPIHHEEKPKSLEKKDEKDLAKPDDSSKSVIETVQPSPKEYSDEDSDDEMDIPQPQDKPISQPTSLVTSVLGAEVKSPLQSEEKPKSPEKKDEKVLAKPDDSSKSVIETVKPSPKEYSANEDSDDEMDIPKPQDKQVSHPTSLVTSVTGSGDKSLLNTAEKSQSPEKKDDKVLAKPEDSSNHPTSFVTDVTGAGVKSPLQFEEKPKSPEKKDEKVLAKPDDSSNWWA
ncbi:uncharacterized protein Dere_GG27175 [Drosophila erecta]|uniref:Uncharacterized protein n=1 Tax=Drosophila erecta TaxID=7220 RepID=A0A0Q5UHR7_DROER|nr:uncharacterized protein Dere_GG27175 [Drosophila erecta]